MENKEKGYVYILTNPSFREDWIKIGKTGRHGSAGQRTQEFQILQEGNGGGIRKAVWVDADNEEKH